MTRRAIAAVTVAALTAALVGVSTLPARAEQQPLTNTAHLDFLLDTVAPAEIEGHTTYRLAEEPQLRLPWTYADARPGGTFERIGGGSLDPQTGDYSQGAFNADDVSRAAVVYLRHWQQTGSEQSRAAAYDLLRALAYFQTTTGADAGNVVLWMQRDGELNPSAEPVELPDPSDSEDSYWLARTLWAFGEGYAAFRAADPAFAAFLQERLRLAAVAVDREVLGRYGEFDVADGVPVPAWLIVGGADATAEALLGLSSYLVAEPGDAAVRETTARLAEGVELFARTTTEGDVSQWPYGAALPWTASRSMWHAWGSQMPTALVRASAALDDAALAEPALVEGVRFAPVLLTAGGPDNGWFPSPTERVQIAYGADSRLQASLALAGHTGSPLFTDLAGMQGAWYFGLNPANEPMYDPSTGVTFDGIQPDGSINRNSGAESTIHGLLSMLALDGHPDVAARATGITTQLDRSGLEFLQAEQVVSGGTIETPASGWTGESSFNGDLVRIPAGSTATVDLGGAKTDRIVEPVSWYVEEGGAVPHSEWTVRRDPVGSIDHVVGARGVTEAAGALLPQRLEVLPRGVKSLTASVTGADLLLDGVLVRPAVVSIAASGSAGATALFHNSGDAQQRVPIRAGDWRGAIVRVYDATGALVDEHRVAHTEHVRLPAGGTVVLSR